VTPEMEEQRAANLRDAQEKAAALFDRVESRGLIRAGATEKTVSDEIYALAAEQFGVAKHWHKRIVRAGRNTLAPYSLNPPNLAIGADDIVFLDFGPIFEAWEADFGRTYVLGSDPLKVKLRDDVESAFAEGKAYFDARPDITASELFRYATTLAGRYRWEFGGTIAGHLIGRFPHERISGDRVSLYVHPQNDRPMRSLDERGRRRHWILEIHFVDRAREIGGFFEELLTV
jgi:Xaa-Pro dipeptidase